jgi:hypothetical protein
LVVKVGNEVAQELEESAAWYEKEDPGLGARLVDDFAHAVRLLEEPNPPLTPVGGKAISRWSVIVVIAFAHHSRKSGYWIDRNAGQRTSCSDEGAAFTSPAGW